MHLSNIIVRYLTSFYPVLSYSAQAHVVLGSRAHECEVREPAEKLVMESVYG